jgi:hypothetical protein
MARRSATWYRPALIPAQLSFGTAPAEPVSPEVVPAADADSAGSDDKTLEGAGVEEPTVSLGNGPVSMTVSPSSTSTAGIVPGTDSGLDIFPEAASGACVSVVSALLATVSGADSGAAKLTRRLIGAVGRAGS